MILFWRKLLNSYETSLKFAFISIWKGDTFFAGQCLCVDNVEGRFCDRCAENFYNLRERCLPCDDCYALIQTRRDAIVTDADRFQQTLDDLATTPVHVSKH